MTAPAPDAAAGAVLMMAEHLQLHERGYVLRTIRMDNTTRRPAGLVVKLTWRRRADGHAVKRARRMSAAASQALLAFVVAPGE